MLCFLATSDVATSWLAVETSDVPYAVELHDSQYTCETSKNVRIFRWGGCITLHTTDISAGTQSLLSYACQTLDGDSRHCEYHAQRRSQHSRLLVVHEEKTTAYSSFINFFSRRLKVSSALSESPEERVGKYDRQPAWVELRRTSLHHCNFYSDWFTSRMSWLCFASRFSPP